MNMITPNGITYRATANTVINAVVDNYLFSEYDAPTQAMIYADVVGVLNILWKDLEFKVLPSFNSYSIDFDFTIYVDKDDPIFIRASYNWG